MSLVNATFGRERRVRHKAEFQQIQREGRRIKTSHFVLVLARQKETASAPRLGITASRKVGCAVRRNRIKRLLREAFRLGSLGLGEGYDLVVIVLKDDPAYSLSLVSKELHAASAQVERAAKALKRPAPEGGASGRASGT